MDVNYFGPVALIQAAIPPLKVNPKGGLIINVLKLSAGGLCRGCRVLCQQGRPGKNGRKPAGRVSSGQHSDQHHLPRRYGHRFNDNSLGASSHGRGRREGESPERVAKTILNTICHEQRDVFITFFDRTFVTVSALWPWLMDKLLSRHYQGSM